jgi:TetR/AcrR family transcriptional regulator, fatty acid metabolism regulator protein
VNQVSQQSDERAVKRRAILDAAVETFAEHGFAKSRTRQIAEAAGVAEGTIYLYFEGKDDLLLTAFREKVTEFCEVANQLLRKPGTFENRLERFIEIQFSGIEEDPALATVLLLESRQSSRFYGEPVREVLRSYAAAVDRLIQSGVEEGRLRESLEIPMIRRMLIGSLEEIELDWLLGPRGRSLTSMARGVASVFCTGIVRGGADA